MEPQAYEKLLIKWQFRFHKSEKAHYRSATACRVFNYALGIPLVIITVIVASDIFGLLEALAETQYPWKAEGNMGLEAKVVSLLSVLAPVLAALQTFLRFPERAEQHHNAAVKFGLLKKEIEMQMVLWPDSAERRKEILEEILAQHEEVIGQSPSIGTFSLFRTRFDVKPMTMPATP
ncbi:hypothetical protein DESC_10033 [Desulfosarcina cetonica]|uniref:SLATT domain-containing protein n=1 Tax=Desulfosarcina cetonica TaxID=90730 RepID=UPI0006D14CC2|nr:SLATT domain-containing protein [Desulfosarcina cetonica]VTR63765.1 hypothetical protein DESC_10033 [Desulfosarcina cetonica]